MTFSVGVLYSSRSLLQVVSEGSVDTTNFAASFDKIEVADGQTVLAVSQKCRWIAIESSGVMRLTERGQALLGIAESEKCLREQLFDLIGADPPPWARTLIQGRFEALRAMPDAAKQCFRECNLLEGFDDDTVYWWDRTSNSVRVERTRINHEVGRKAEKLTLEFERQRTRQEPVWQAVETNVSGFDVLSIVEAGSTTKLKIEVKGSRLPRKQAPFYLTRNEWDTAINSHEFHFHLWLVHDIPVLFVVPAKLLEPHVPQDGASGRWETAQLFFKEFVSCQCPMPMPG
jgi:hypothetical protein